MTTKTLTLGQILDAIEQNGLPQTRDGWFFKGYNPLFGRIRDQNVSADLLTITEACALGQAAINLGVSPVFTVDDAPIDVFDEIVNMNDNSKMTFAEIARYFRDKYAQYLDTFVESEIIDYGDKVKYVQPT